MKTYFSYFPHLFFLRFSDKGTTYYFSIEALGESRRSEMGGEVEVK